MNSRILIIPPELIFLETIIKISRQPFKTLLQKTIFFHCCLQRLIFTSRLVEVTHFARKGSREIDLDLKSSRHFVCCSLEKNCVLPVYFDAKRDVNSKTSKRRHGYLSANIFDVCSTSSTSLKRHIRNREKMADCLLRSVNDKLCTKSGIKDRKTFCVESCRPKDVHQCMYFIFQRKFIVSYLFQFSYSNPPQIPLPIV